MISQMIQSLYYVCAGFCCMGHFNCHVITRVNYAVEQGARVDDRNDATIIMYIGTQCHTLHLLNLSPILKYEAT